MYEGGDGKNCETFPRIPDEPSKPRNFSPSKLLSFMVILLHPQWWQQLYNMNRLHNMEKLHNMRQLHCNMHSVASTVAAATVKHEASAQHDNCMI